MCLSSFWSPLLARTGFFSVIKVLLFLLVFMLQALPAMAVNAPNYKVEPKTFMFNNSNGTGISYPTGEQACDMSDGVAGPQAGAPTAGVDTLFTFSGPAYDATSYLCKWTYRSNGAINYVSRLVTFWCPYGGTMSGEWCINVPEGGGPPPPNPCSDKNPIIRRYNYSKPPYTSPDNFAGCKVTVVEMLTCGKTSAGQQYCFWKIVRTGAVYTGPDTTATGAGSTDNTSVPDVTAQPVPAPPLTPPPPATPDICKSCVPCPRGTVQAGVGPDGVPMCIGTGTNAPPPPPVSPTTTKPPTTTTAADGTKTNVQQTVQSNSDGSSTTTTTTTVTKPDGTTSVSTGSTVSAGTSGSPGRTDTAPADDKYNLCKTNPTLSICRESSVSGSCAETSCVGDAIQCVTLRAAAAMQCKQKEDEEALKGLPAYAKGLAAANGADPDADTLPTVKNASVVDMKAMDQNGWIGGGQAFSDVSFSVQGHSVTVPLNEWSGYLVGLRYALMVVALLVSFRMLSGVILRD